MSVSADDEDIVPQPGDVDLLKKQEQKLIGAVMKRTGGDKSQAAVMLGISPTTLWRKMKEYGVEGV